MSIQNHEHKSNRIDKLCTVCGKRPGHANHKRDEEVVFETFVGSSVLTIDTSSYITHRNSTPVPDTHSGDGGDIGGCGVTGGL